MEDKFTVKAVYSGGITLIIRDMELKKAIDVILKKIKLNDFEPASLVVCEEKKILKFDRKRFSDYVKGKLSWSMLCEKTVFCGYHRNINDIETESGTIDTGSLWSMGKDCLMILVDDDQYVEHHYDEEQF